MELRREIFGFLGGQFGTSLQARLPHWTRTRKARFHCTTPWVYAPFRFSCLLTYGIKWSFTLSVGYCGVFCVLCVRGVCARGGVRGTVGAPLDSITFFASGGTLRKFSLYHLWLSPKSCYAYHIFFISLNWSSSASSTSPSSSPSSSTSSSLSSLLLLLLFSY